jgi:hypothetical protein
MSVAVVCAHILMFYRFISGRRGERLSGTLANQRTSACPRFRLVPLPGAEFSAETIARRMRGSRLITRRRGVAVPVEEIRLRGLPTDRLDPQQLFAYGQQDRPLLPPLRPFTEAAGTGSVGWLPALGTRGFRRPLSDPRADLRLRLHGLERDGRDVPIPDLQRVPRALRRQRLSWS